MTDFFVALPPDLLVRYARERQAEIRDEVERRRLATRASPARRTATIAQVLGRLRRAALRRAAGAA